MMELLFASQNKGKIAEVQAILNELNIRVLSLSDVGLDVDVVEDGDTFEANALKKAVEIMKLSGKTVLADDSGLEIDCLDKKPGVLSARFLGHDTPYDVKNQQLLDMIRDVPDGKRGARFVCVMALAFPNGETATARGEMEGAVSYEAKGSGGFGYDPIFFIPELGKTSGELSPYAKNKISHRRKALDGVKKILEARK